tara:strand:+ start:390 stop:674 length:285 start_codon:yes stop_codon:yes gene_type:complete
MKYNDTQQKEYLIKQKRELIFNHLVESFYRIEKKESIDLIIKDHKKFINNLNIKAKHHSKYKTLTQLNVYKNSKDKIHALSCFSNYLNNLKLFR